MRRSPIFGMPLVFNPLPRLPHCDTIPEKASAHYSSRHQAPDFQRAAPRSALLTTGASSCHRVRINPSRRAVDLADALAERPVLGKTAYRARVRRVIKSAKSQTVAGNSAKGLRATCKRVVAAKGAAVKG